LDPHYAFSAVAFIVGVAAGGQDVSSRYPADTVKSSFTVPGLFYLATRGAVPAALFAAAYYNHWIQTWLFLCALGFGAGAEAFLRSQFLVKQSTAPNGGIEEVLKGPLDLLRWYQDKCLGSIDTTDCRKKLQLCARSTSSQISLRQPMVCSD